MGAVAVTLGVPAAPASAYPYATVAVEGHGWGPGLGMGQWGALGDALGGMDFAQILAAYYGTLADGQHTTVGSLPGGWNDATTPVTVALTGNGGNDVIVTSGSLFTVSGVAGTFGPGQTWGAVRFHATGAGTPGATWEIDAAHGCAGPWTALTTGETAPVATPVTAPAFPFGGTTAQLEGDVLQLCQNPADDDVRGTIGGVFNSAEQPRTVDVVPLGQYVADVTPSESPTGWGSLGSPESGEPQGFQELEAQAVAARSYVMSTYGALAGYFGYADICDVACQSYPGVANENTTTDAAVTDTDSLAVLLPGGTAVARTTYSSSTGGYTDAGTFAAVPDPGDSVCVPGACNAHHTWTAQIPVAAVDGAYPQIGSLVSIGVTGRNGLGDLGGRVEQVVVQGTAGSTTVTGASFAAAFAGDGVQSDWFAFTSQASGGVGGYWMAGTDGGVFAFGAAPFDGSLGAVKLAAPVVGMAGGPGGAGYWMVAADGGIFAFGDAAFHGSMGGRRLAAPMVGMAPTPDGAGYWTVAADGGIFSFGDAAFHGSLGSVRLAQPIVAMARTPDGAGYWLLGADGGVFSFGDAAYLGSLPGLGVHARAVALLPTADGDGYVVLTSDGQALSFGDAPQFGDVSTAVPGYPGHVVGGATVPG
ncbi:MAG TPA: SpoIID/LytB domain-containing protein [Acidimicrobiales bacterium]|nr:SpoIID/LytB domain-containing protein [Acidimicrobiales bacterium]